MTLVTEAALEQISIHWHEVQCSKSLLFAKKTSVVPYFGTSSLPTSGGQWHSVLSRSKAQTVETSLFSYLPKFGI